MKHYNEKPTVINSAVKLETGFREPTSADGKFHERKKPLEYAEMEGMEYL